MYFAKKMGEEREKEGKRKYKSRNIPPPMDPATRLDCCSLDVCWSVLFALLIHQGWGKPTKLQVQWVNILLDLCGNAQVAALGGATLCVDDTQSSGGRPEK